MAVMLGAGCSSMDSESTADHHVGPVGPTYPSYLFFDATVTPHSIMPPSTATFMVRVWDNNGNLVSGVPVIFTGAQTSAIVTTGDAGIAYLVLELKGNAAGVIWITVWIEDTSLTIPIQSIGTSAA